MSEDDTLPAPLVRAAAQRVEHGVVTPTEELLAEECAVALLVNGEPQLVVLATPQDLDDFVYGFALSEGWIEHADELRIVDRLRHPEGISLQLALPESRATALQARQGQLTARGGCGLCGSDTLQAAIRPIRHVTRRLRLAPEILNTALHQLTEAQPLNRRCGGLHAAAALIDGKLDALREDVGRHNALDKTLGALERSDQQADALLVTSRASYELVHKAAQCGVELLAAVSAPSAFALRLAEHAGMTLVGFARDGRFTIYSHAFRLLP